MHRTVRYQSIPGGACTSTPDAAWRFAQAILGNPVPNVSRAEAEAQAERKLSEWVAKVAPEHGYQLRAQLSAEAKAKADRKLLEWLAKISPEHEVELRSLQRAEAEAREAKERAERFSQGPDVREAEWDQSKHPRGAFAQNRGWWSPTSGSGGAGNGAERPPSISGAISRRDREVADLIGGMTPGMVQSSRLAMDLQSAARLPDEILRAVLSGLGTGHESTRQRRCNGNQERGHPRTKH
jgi:hypothetical protein